MEETYPKDKLFSFYVYVEEDFIEEFPTLDGAKREAREQARIHEGMPVYVVKYREVYRVKEKGE